MARLFISGNEIENVVFENGFMRYNGEPIVPVVGDFDPTKNITFKISITGRIVLENTEDNECGITAYYFGCFYNGAIILPKGSTFEVLYKDNTHALIKIVDTHFIHDGVTIMNWNNQNDFEYRPIAEIDAWGDNFAEKTPFNISYNVKGNFYRVAGGTPLKKAIESLDL